MPEARSRAAVEDWIRELAPCAAAETDAERKRIEAEQQARERAAQVQRTIDHGRQLRVAGIVATAGGLALIGGGIAFAIKGQSVNTDLANQCHTIGCGWDLKQTKDLDAEGHRANTFAVLGFVAGGMATLTGAGLFVWGRTRIHTVVEPRADGAAVSATVHF